MPMSRAPETAPGSSPGTVWEPVYSFSANSPTLSDDLALAPS
jgi:hypothetical protein